MQVIWIETALADLDDIFDYLFACNPTAAKNTAARIFDAARPLDDHPRYGTEISELPGRYKIKVTRTQYLIIYRIEPDRDRILVTRVIHGKRQWRELLGGKTPK